MKRVYVWISVALLSVFVMTLAPTGSAKEVVRRMKACARSHDDQTYRSWPTVEGVFRQYLSEYAYANWMYAARYARTRTPKLLAKGVSATRPIPPRVSKPREPRKTGDVEGRKYLEAPRPWISR
jgi:hypothetical protein